MPAPINLQDFSVNKIGNADIERNYINAILHAIVGVTNDLQAQIDASGGGAVGDQGSFIVAQQEPSLPNARQLFGETGVISVDDGGAGTLITVGIVAGGIGNSKLNITGTPSATTVIGADGTTLSYVELSASGVASVTDDGNSVVSVDNTDPANPIITLDDQPDQTFIGNNTGGSAPPEAIDMTDATAMLDLFTASLQGLVPPPITIAPPGSPATYLKEDGTWDIVFPPMSVGTAGQFLTNDGTIPNWDDLPAFPVGANPTAQVGLTAVNGVATTFMRSDGAPSIDQNISPTWTGVHTFSDIEIAGSGVVNGPSASFYGGNFHVSGTRGYYWQTSTGGSGGTDWARIQNDASPVPASLDFSYFSGGYIVSMSLVRSDGHMKFPLGIEDNGFLLLTGVVSPAALSGTGTTNDWNPGITDVVTIRQDLSGIVPVVRTITGLVGGVAGKIIVIVNINTANRRIVLTHEGAGSTAGNRFILPGASSVSLGPLDTATFIYDGTSSRWRAISTPAPTAVTTVTRGPMCNFDGGGVAISGTVIRQAECPYAFSGTGWTIVGDVSGSCSVAVKKSSYAGYPTTSAVLTASVTTAFKNQATGLTYSLAAGDILQFVLSGVTSMTNITITLDGTGN